MSEFDAVVVGAGPNGLAAAAHLTRSGRKVLVVEQADRIGGGTRTEELTLPGFAHDVSGSPRRSFGISSSTWNGFTRRFRSPTRSEGAEQSLRLVISTPRPGSWARTGTDT
jgi:flavin-dependent dehydrogenase